MGEGPGPGPKFSGKPTAFWQECAKVPDSCEASLYQDTGGKVKLSPEKVIGSERL